MSKYHFPDEEQILVAGYIEYQRGAENRLPIQCFTDSVSLDILRAIEHLESEEKPISGEAILAYLKQKDDLSNDLGVYTIAVNDPEKRYIPEFDIDTIEGTVRDAYGIREAARLHATSTSKCEAGEDPVEVHVSYLSNWKNVETVIQSDWPEPLPIVAKSEALPFPSFCLPGEIRKAVSEVREHIQAPDSMVAFSALSYVSLCTQHLGDIARDASLDGPISNYFLIVGDSGERKTACDKAFGRVVKKHISAEIEALDAEITAWKSAHEIWQSRRAGIKDSIKGKSKRGASTDAEAAELNEIDKREPQPPRIPAMIFENETPQSLRKKLSYHNPRAWLSTGLMSSEGGTILGSHAMQGESKLDMLTTLNKQWDGDGVKSGRVGDGDHDTDGARLSVGIGVQESVLRGFLADDTASGCGSLARCLLAYPESTKGNRPYREPGPMPNVERFGKRLVELLLIEPDRDDAGRLVLPVLTLSSEAKRIWVAHFDEIESRQGRGGDLSSSDVSAIASKTMELAARLAGNIHFFEGGSADDPVSKSVMDGAIQIARWSLGEWIRFIDAGGASREVDDACRLDRWLCTKAIEFGTVTFKERDIYQGGPKPLRASEVRDIRLRPALRFLHRLGRVRYTESSGVVKLNPKLVEN